MQTRCQPDPGQARPTTTPWAFLGPILQLLSLASGLAEFTPLRTLQQIIFDPQFRQTLPDPLLDPLITAFFHLDPFSPWPTPATMSSKAVNTAWKYDITSTAKGTQKLI